jgi:hypothetical protein
MTPLTICALLPILAVIVVSVQAAGAQPATHVLAVSVSGPPRNQSAAVTVDGQPLPETLPRAESRFGPPSSRAHIRGNEENCRVEWRQQKLVGLFTVALSGLRDGCSRHAGTISLSASAPGWRTPSGLTVGDSVFRIAPRYPQAVSHGTLVELVRYFYGAGFWETALAARISDGRIVALIAYGPPDE